MSLWPGLGGPSKIEPAPSALSRRAVIALWKGTGTFSSMAATRNAFNDDPHPDAVEQIIFDAIEHTHLRTASGADPMKLGEEIRQELSDLGSRDMLDRDRAHRSCALLGVVLAEGLCTGVDHPEAEAYIYERLDDFHATVACTMSLVPELGRETLAASMRKMLHAAASTSTNDFADGEYFGDLFLAAANAVVLSITVE